MWKLVGYESSTSFTVSESLPSMYLSMSASCSYGTVCVLGSKSFKLPKRYKLD